ncbi:unnamed protein product [Rhizoctonia solani]|uniref:Cyanovirin-N domain-containing protein n=1 Tax=Rhizoctonia solani TaxID=456999 RepID=A0A8H3DNY1_9AGAM|nr:unnamed protein product [Rhizoctonia solani]CAE6531159.1 unnamed protein product [Rhizoctonia solani]
MSFVSSAKIGSIRLKDGHILAATLKRENQQWNDASFDLNSCLGNTEGRLVWGGQSFSHSAVGVEFEVSETGPRVSLGAILKKADGSDQGSMVNLNDRLANINGEFMYIGSTPIPEGVPGGTNLQDNDLLTGEVEIHPGTPPVYKCTVRLCLCIPGFPPHLPHTPFSGIPTFPPTQRPGPDETSLPPERAHGTIMCLPPNDTLCTAFVAMFTEPMGLDLGSIGDTLLWRNTIK